MAVFPSFIFDTSKGETPQTIAMKRALAAQIMGGFGNRPARNVGEGIGNAFASLGQGITANVMNRRAAAGEEAGQATAGDLRQQLISSMMGQSSFPAAPNPGNTSSMATMPAPDYASARVAQAHNAGSPLPNSFLSAVDSTEGAGGYDTLFGHAQRGPFAGTDVSQMTIGDALAFASPSGAYGQHVKGQIGRVATPMGRHQIVGTTLRNAVQEMGLDPSTPFDRNTQDTIAAHLARRRIASADTMEGKVSALRSEWEGFKNVPRSQMEQIVRDLEAAPAAQPSASGLTPEALQAWGATAYAMPAGGALGAVNALGAAQPVPVAENEADIIAQEQAMAAQDPAAFAAQGAMPQAAPMQQQPVQVAQAGGFPEMAGRDPSRPPPPDLNMLMHVLSNPFMDDGTKAYAQAVLNQHMQAQDPSHQLDMDYRRAQIEKLNREAAGGNRRYGLNPIYGQDAQGNTVLGVLGDDGSFKPVDTGGVNISTGVDRVDLGTQWGLLDKRSGQMVGTLPKENYQEAFDTASGTNDAKSAAEARANLPKVEDNATAILGMIESLSTDPYLDSMVGPVSGRLPNVSADAARVQSKMDQIGGQAFLQAFETLRGGGQISNEEGKRATAAIARLNTSQNPADYRQALEELSTIVRTSLDRARRSAGAGAGSNPPPGASGDGWQDMGGVRIRRKQ